MRNWFLLIPLLLLPMSCFGQANAVVANVGVINKSYSLADGLVAYWKLDETSGTRADSEPTGTAQDLTDNNTVTSNTGKIGNAGQFTAANIEYLSRADSADLSVGDIDFSVSMWVYMDTLPAVSGTRRFVAHYSYGNSNASWGVDCGNTGGTIRFRAYASSNGIVATTLTANTFGTPSATTWYHLIFVHDASTDLIWLYINNGAGESLTHTGGCFNSTAAFTLGTLLSSGAPEGATLVMNGRIDEVGLWKKVLSSGERAELYNAGAGKTCCPF